MKITSYSSCLCNVRGMKLDYEEGQKEAVVMWSTYVIMHLLHYA